MHIFENVLGAVKGRVGGGGEACRGVKGWKNLDRSFDRLVSHAFDPPLVAAWAGGLSTLRGAPPQHTLGATICFGEERQVWTDLGWKFEPGKAPKATIWASKMAPKSTMCGS